MDDESNSPHEPPEPNGPPEPDESVPLPLERSDPDRPASASPTEPVLERESPVGHSRAGHDPYAALRVPAYLRYASGKVVYDVGQQMLSVAIGWQVYELTNSKTALGLIGLMAAIPLIALALPAGHVADRFNRKRITQLMQIGLAVSSFGLALASMDLWRVPDVGVLRGFNGALATLAHLFPMDRESRFDNPVVPLLFLLLLASGVCQAFHDPARSSMLPLIVPLRVFSNAVTWNSSAFQVSSMVGPALGGLVIGVLPKPWGYVAAYAACGLACLYFVWVMTPVAVATHDRPKEEVTLRTLAAGVGFVWRTKIVLATITLDLFAVLLGGAVALLPVFADMMKVGPVGLGVLRASPAVGAVVSALLIAHLPPMKKAGRAMLWSVAGFGAATIVFGLAPVIPGLMTPVFGLPGGFWVSLLMLAFTGVCDNVSVVVRHTLVQVLTPDSMRGRVSAVNNVFIGSSNELGALESGLTAAAFGPILSVVGGGIGTILVVIAVAVIWPQVRAYGSLDDAHGESGMGT